MPKNFNIFLNKFFNLDEVGDVVCLSFEWQCDIKKITTRPFTYL